MTKNKLIALLLSVVLILACIPAQVFADETDQFQPEPGIEEPDEESNDSDDEGEEGGVLPDEDDETGSELGDDDSDLDEPTENPTADIPGDEPIAKPTAAPIAEIADDKASIKYRAHVQNIGWQGWKTDGVSAGTTGQSKRVEALQISVTGSQYQGGITYSAHVQNIGWQSWKNNGATSGTTGQSKRVEAIKIKLTGELANHYDVYYRAHSQQYGWLNWAKNGSASGTAGFSYRMESVQIKLVKKGASAPGATTVPYVSKAKVSYSAHVQSIGWQSWRANGSTAGTTGQKKRTEALKIKVDSHLSGDIQYTTHVQNVGWTSASKNGAISGSTGRSLRMEAITVKLTGQLASYYDVYYRVHSQNFGWLGWAKNGATAGTSGYAYRAEALQIVLVAKGAKAPGSTSGAFKKAPVSQLASIRTSLNSASGAKSISAFGGFSLSQSDKSALSTALLQFGSYNVGFIMVDINSGKGVAYNADRTFYSASTIKGPYVASVASKSPSSITNSGSTMKSTIKASSNEGYISLRNKYGKDPIKKWCSDAGVSTSIGNLNYPYYSPRQLAKLWTKNYEYFFGTTNGSKVRAWYTSSTGSAIHQTLGSKYTVYTKPGWIGSSLKATNDAGIVWANGKPYLVAIMSDAPAQQYRLKSLISTLDSVHKKM